MMKNYYTIENEDKAAALHALLQRITGRNQDQSQYIELIELLEYILMEYRRSISAMDDERIQISIYQLSECYDKYITPFFRWEKTTLPVYFKKNGIGKLVEIKEEKIEEKQPSLFDLMS